MAERTVTVEEYDEDGRVIGTRTETVWEPDTQPCPTCGGSGTVPS